jgi:hypothetical protein
MSWRICVTGLGDGFCCHETILPSARNYAQPARSPTPAIHSVAERHGPRPLSSANARMMQFVGVAASGPPR